MRLGQGRDNVKELFASSPDLAEEIEKKIYAAMKESAEEAKAKKPRPAAPQPPAPEPTTKANARAKLDIVVDDDE